MTHAERVPFIQLAILLLVIIAYGLLQFWIIPTYVKESERKIAITYTGYSLTIATTLIYAGNIIAGILDRKK
jgi:preprotein translocase subunit SecY